MGRKSKKVTQLERDLRAKVEKYGLGSYEVMKDYDGSAESGEYYAWWYFPELIDFHRAIRQTVPTLHIINISILINSAIVIEGFLYELIKYNVGEKLNDNSLEFRLNQDFNEKLDNSTWSDLKGYYKTATGLDLHSATSNENWKSISTLFHFRNMLTHSKPVKFTVKVVNNKPVMKHFGHYENVYNFLVEKKLVKPVNFVRSMNTDLINSAIVDFFWSETQIFLKNVLNSNKESYNPLIWESYEIAFEYKSSQ
ncbi:hypothetical protein [Rubrolithibacter danxiaensis]|uniref:hypothetical protein n=1 Tax=Rubrolithibacter danxiaensis TaxID=3390805 RepID=UPI003BF83623